MDIEDVKKKIKKNHLYIFDILKDVKKIKWNFLANYRFENLKYLWDISKSVKIEADIVTEDCPIVTVVKKNCIPKDYLEIKALYEIFKTLPCIYFDAERYNSAFIKIIRAGIFHKYQNSFNALNHEMIDVLFFPDASVNPRTFYIPPELNDRTATTVTAGDRLLSFFEMLACSTLCNMSIVVWTFFLFQEKMSITLRDTSIRIIFDLEDERNINSFKRYMYYFRMSDDKHLNEIKIPFDNDEDASNHYLFSKSNPPNIDVKFYINLFSGDLSQFFFTTPLESVSMMLSKMRSRYNYQSLDDVLKDSNTQTLTMFEKDGMSVITKHYPYRNILYTSLFDPCLPNERHISTLDTAYVHLDLIKKSIFDIFLRNGIKLDSNKSLLTNVHTFQNIEQILSEHYRLSHPNNKHGLSALEEVLNSSRSCTVSRGGGQSDIHRIIGKRYRPC